MTKGLLRAALAIAAGCSLGTTFPAQAVPSPPAGQEIRESRTDPIWPAPSAYEWYWHKANDGLSQAEIDASMTAVRSGLFTFGNAKGPLTGASVSRTRIQFEYKSPAGPSRSYFPPKLLESLRMYYASSQHQGQKWLVIMNLTTQGVFQIYLEKEAYARAFIDASASAAKMAGAVLENKEGRGFAVSDLSPAQVQALGKSRLEGALVTMIAYGGPAEKAGLRFLDLIAEVDGVKVRNADHLGSILDAADPGASLNLTCLERVEGTAEGGPAFVWKPKAVVWTQDPRP